jgi:hypothetical protein
MRSTHGDDPVLDESYLEARMVSQEDTLLQAHLAHVDMQWHATQIHAQFLRTNSTKKV